MKYIREIALKETVQLSVEEMKQVYGGSGTDSSGTFGGSGTKPCDGKKVGDECSYVRSGHTYYGKCCYSPLALPGHEYLYCNTLNG